MSQILITGGNGWLGSQLIRILLNGLPEANIDPISKQKIKCLIIPGSDKNIIHSISKEIEIFEGDLRNVDSVKDFCSGGNEATLFHCAGIIHPNRNIKELFDVNVTGTENLLKSAINFGVKRTVIVSSNSPTGVSNSPNIIFDETSPYNPYMNYGHSKMLMEKMVQQYQETGGIEAVIVKAPWFYGTGQPPRQTLFFSMIKNGKVPLIGDGNNLRSMTYLDNLCQGLILCAKIQNANGQTYWIADEKPYKMNEIIDTIEELLEKEFKMKVTHKRVKLPYLTGEFATLMDRCLQSFGLYNQKIHVLSEMNKNIACSIEKAKRELGYKPTISLKEGMKRSIRWCLKNGHSI